MSVDPDPLKIPAGNVSHGPKPASSHFRPLDVVEEKHVRKVLSSAHTLEEAARILGINVATLWRKRKRYGI
jgi:NtrC-family two-component system response regulator AlgB